MFILTADTAPLLSPSIYEGTKLLQSLILRIRGNKVQQKYSIC